MQDARVRKCQIRAGRESPLSKTLLGSHEWQEVWQDWFLWGIDFWGMGWFWSQAGGGGSQGDTFDKNHTGIDDRCVSSWFLFSSCGILSTGSRMDDWPLPRQTFFEPHNFTMTSLIKSIHLPHQWQLSPSTKLSHITPQEPQHHQELFKRSPVGFLLKSTGNWPRSWVQD